MLELSTDPDVARQEMQGLIFYLAAFGYIDGEIDATELAFIEETFDKVVEHRVDAMPGGDDPKRHEELMAQEAALFDGLLETTQQEVTQLLNDSVIETETRHFFLRCRLKQRCFEIFQAFSFEQQRELLATVDRLLVADGSVHPAEAKFRNELAELLRAEVELPDMPTPISPRVEIDERALLPLDGPAHANFALFEHSYRPKTKFLKRQIAADRRLVRKALAILQRKRKKGLGQLDGTTSVDQLAGKRPFLDRSVYVVPPEEGTSYEMTVIGDLHGCYSCLKAALTQSRFLEKVASFRRSPEGRPKPMLVFLGDYIDRGRYSFNGVLRMVLQLFTVAPEHVFILRGNHELFVEQEGTIHSLIMPSDALDAIRPFAPEALLREYKRLFDALPTSLLFGRLMFTHGGIPQDGLIKARFEDLTSLNDPAIRYQMLWSDPSISDVIPRNLQETSVRFGFGRLQCQAFLQRFGCHTLIRGHGMVPMGFHRNFDDEGVMLVTLCSTGGLENRDLPKISDYRMVRPMALSLRTPGGLDGPVELDAWPVEYKPFNESENNGFYAELEPPE